MGCGIVSALQVVEVIATGRQSLAALVGGMTKYPQVMINVPVEGSAHQVVEEAAEVAAALSEAQSQLAGQGRVILRPSGTEPVVRVTVEGRDRQTVQMLAEELAGLLPEQ